MAALSTLDTSRGAHEQKLPAGASQEMHCFSRVTRLLLCSVPDKVGYNAGTQTAGHLAGNDSGGEQGSPITGSRSQDLPLSKGNKWIRPQTVRL